MDDVDALQGGSGAVGATLEQVAALSAGQMHAENFPVALRLLPRRPRTELAQIYAYARFVDDLGDEAPGDRAQLLDVVEAEVRALWTGTPTLPIVAALQPAVVTHSIPAQPLLDLIEANRVDQHVTRYQTFDELLGYCRLSAAPVGELVLHLADAATERNLADSAAVCAALQVLEHCQDVGEDARAGRTYLPAVELRAAAVTDAELLIALTSRPLRGVVAAQVAQARELLAAGAPLVGRLHGWARVAVAGFVAGGLATADALDAANHDVLYRDVRPGNARTAAHALRLLSPRGRR